MGLGVQFFYGVLTGMAALVVLRKLLKKPEYQTVNVTVTDEQDEYDFSGIRMGFCLRDRAGQTNLMEGALAIGLHMEGGMVVFLTPDQAQAYSDADVSGDTPTGYLTAILTGTVDYQEYSQPGANPDDEPVDCCKMVVCYRCVGVDGTVFAEDEVIIETPRESWGQQFLECVEGVASEIGEGLIDAGLIVWEQAV